MTTAHLEPATRVPPCMETDLERHTSGALAGTGLPGGRSVTDDAGSNRGAHQLSETRLRDAEPKEVAQLWRAVAEGHPFTG